MKKLDVNDCSFAHLTLILLPHYLVKRRSRSLVVHNNTFILDSACIGSVTVSRRCLLQSADDKQLINCLRRLKGYSSRRFLKEFLQKN